MVDRPTVEFDQFTADYARNWQHQLEAIQEGPRIAWTEAHDGYWVLTDYEAVARVGTDYKAFSSDNDLDSARQGSRGILIPRNPFQLTLNEEDPPQSTKYRMLEAPFFTPKYLPRWAEVARKHTDAAIDHFIESGRCDLVHDLAMPVPAKTTLQIVGVDAADWAAFALPAHMIAFTPSSSPDYPLDALLDIQARLGALLERRLHDPRDDVASRLAHATVDGAPLPRNIAIVMLSTLVTGGFDTTTSLMCHALAWLEDQPEQRQRMLADAKLMDNAVEEFLRVFPPTHGTARNVVEDVELCGQQLRAGERILMSYPAANRDPAKFACPHDIRIDRSNAREHLSFGSGHHRCLGAPLAKLETKIVIDAVLRRMPDYRLDKEMTRPYPTAGMIDGFLSMPVSFTPGQRLQG